MVYLGLPIKNGDFPWQTVSHNQRVLVCGRVTIQNLAYRAIRIWGIPFPEQPMSYFSGWREALSYELRFIREPCVDSNVHNLRMEIVPNPSCSMGKKKHQAFGRFTSLLVSAATGCAVGVLNSCITSRCSVTRSPDIKTLPGNSGFVLDLFILDAQPLGG